MALLLVLALYALAATINLLIPPSGAQPHAVQPALRALIARFAQAQGTLWRDPLAGISLGVTTLFWGAGATLQFVVLHWAQQSLGLSLSGAAYLQGVVAIGIGAGALVAGRWVRLDQAPQVLPLGVLMGLCVPLLTLVHSVPVAVPLLAAVGALAGFFVVPMNALLQHRGQQLLGAGESIAVQNFNENLCVLAMLGAYAGLQAAGWPLHRLVFLLGALTALGVMGVMWRYRLMGGRKQLLKGEQS